ncbi:MAG: hypothetical protein NVS9B8_11850 [Candidatus Limnocylindrales bacterium]
MSEVGNTSAVTASPASDVGPRIVPEPERLDSVPWRVAAIAAGAFLAASAGALLDGVQRGLDITDEGLYLLAADNHQPAAAFIGWFGHYTGVILAAVGHDIAWFRVVGVLMLLAAGAILGGAVLRLLGVARLAVAVRVIVLCSVSAATLVNYSLFIRSPGYNWLALLGVLLAVAGILLMLTLDRGDRRAALVAGVLIATGCFLATWAKISAGVGLAGLATVVGLIPGLGDPVLRRRALLTAVLAGTLLVGLHLVFVADAGTTVATIRRSLAMLAVVDPRYYRVGSALDLTVRDVVAAPAAIVGASFGIVFTGFAPLSALAVRPSRRSTVCALATIGALIATAASLAIRGEWLGGIEGYGRVAIADLAILAAAILAAASSAVVAHRTPSGDVPGSARRVAAATVVMVAAAGAYAFGSNNGTVTQTTGAAVLVLGAAALVAGLPFSGRRQTLVVAAGCLVMGMASSLVLVSARDRPYRMASIGAMTETVRVGSQGPLLSLDPASAEYWRRLVQSAQDAGWHPGRPLLDLTWSPAVSWALRATVPDTLVPVVGNARTADAQALAAIRLSGPRRWADAWLLVSPDLGRVHPDRVAASFGRSFPGDYELVIALTAPGLGLRQELWRPRDPAAP